MGCWSSRFSCLVSGVIVTPDRWPRLWLSNQPITHMTQAVPTMTDSLQIHMSMKHKEVSTTLTTPVTGITTVKTLPAVSVSDFCTSHPLNHHSVQESGVEGTELHEGEKGRRLISRSMAWFGSDEQIKESFQGPGLRVRPRDPPAIAGPTPSGCGAQCNTNAFT